MSEVVNIFHANPHYHTRACGPQGLQGAKSVKWNFFTYKHVRHTHTHNTNNTHTKNKKIINKKNNNKKKLKNKK